VSQEQKKETSEVPSETNPWFDPAEMQMRSDRLKAEGRMPSLLTFLQLFNE